MRVRALRGQSPAFVIIGLLLLAAGPACIEADGDGIPADRDTDLRDIIEEIDRADPEPDRNDPEPDRVEPDTADDNDPGDPDDTAEEEEAVEQDDEPAPADEDDAVEEEEAVEEDEVVGEEEEEEAVEDEEVLDEEEEEEEEEVLDEEEEAVDDEDEVEEEAPAVDDEDEVEEEVEEEEEEVEPEPQTVDLRLIHASPDAGPVDVYPLGDNDPTLVAFAYGQATPYLPIPPGTYTVVLTPTGTPPTPASPQVSFTIPETAKRVTAVVAGRATSPDPDSTLRARILVENWGVTAPGTARVRVLHASPDAPAVGLDLGDDGVVEVEGLARFADTGEAGIVVPAGQPVQLGVRAADGASITAFTVNLPNGADVVAVATGFVAERAKAADGFAILAAAATGTPAWVKQNPRIAVGHFASDAPAVDVFAGDKKVVRNVAYGQVTSYFVRRPPGAAALDFFAASTDETRPTSAPAAAGVTDTLLPGEDYLIAAAGLIAVGSDDPRAFRLIAARDDFAAPTAGRTGLALVHGAPDFGAADVGTFGDLRVFEPINAFSGVNFGATAAYPAEGLVAGPLELGVARASTPTARASFDIDLPTAANAWVVAAGVFGTGLRPAASFGLWAVFADPTGGYQTLRLDAVRGRSVQILHAVADAGTIDIWAEGFPTPIFGGVAFGDDSNFVTLPPGYWHFAVTPAGSGTPPTAFPTALRVPVERSRNDAQFALMGAVDPAFPSIDALNLRDMTEFAFRPPTVGESQVVFIDGLAGTERLALDFGDDGDLTGPYDVPDLVKYSVSGRPVSMPADTRLRVALRRSTRSTSPGERLTSFSDLTALDGATHRIVIAGDVNVAPRANTGVQLIAWTQESDSDYVDRVKPEPVFYAFHGVPDRGAVDVWVSPSTFAAPRKVAADLSFGALSGPIQFSYGETGTNVLTVMPAGADYAPSAAVGQVNLESFSVTNGDRVLLPIYGFGDPANAAAAGVPGASVRVWAWPEQFGDRGDGHRVRPAHIAPGAPDVGLYSAIGNQLITAQISYTNSWNADGTAIGPSGPATLLFGTGNPLTVVGSFDFTPTTGGASYLLVAGAVTASLPPAVQRLNNIFQVEVPKGAFSSFTLRALPFSRP